MLTHPIIDDEQMAAAEHTLSIDYAWRSETGGKPDNADACNIVVPTGDLLINKGIAAAIADGMSSSEGGREAAAICVRNFLSDYLSTPESWTVRTSTSRVLGGLNRWLSGQGQVVYDSPRGMVTTFSGLVLKSTTAYIVHVGDTRIYRLRDGDLEQLTRDHRVWIARDREFLARAIGADPNVDIDYRSIALEQDDVFLFSTDGVHDFLTNLELQQLLIEGQSNLQSCANRMVEKALANGSPDNASCQLIKVLALPVVTEDDVLKRIAELPFPPDLSPGMTIDGYEILRELHLSKRSEVFLALDTESGDKVVLKTPSTNYSDDPKFLDGFLHEEWVGRRVRSAHVLKVKNPRRRRFLYNITEYVEGQSLASWMIDNGSAGLNQMREFARQIVSGLRAMHRQEMFHQDLKPENLLIDNNGTLKLIDFGSARISGISEISRKHQGNVAQGTLNYTAPECIQGEPGNKYSDLYSLGVIVYELLTGTLPYGESDRPKTVHRQKYTPAYRHNPEVPRWVDAAIAKAVHPDPRRRYDSLSEFLFDLSQPNPSFNVDAPRPLIDSNPVAFWRGLAVFLLFLHLVLLVT